MLHKSLVAGSASLAIASLFGAAALPAVAASEFLPSDGFYADVRLRYENVEQDGVDKDAYARTIRTKFGYKSGVANGFQFLIEGEDIGRFGDTDFNNTNNGKTSYPVVADPVGTELNQAWVSYAGIPDTTVKAGRQGINLDNQRFVGTVGWRQNDQTLDSVLISNTSIENLSLAFVQVGQVNRIFGDKSPMGELDTDTSILHASYKISDFLTVTGYGYLLDHDDSFGDALSSETYGVRLTGSTALNDDWKLVYEFEAADQSDNGDNPNSYDANYYHIAPAIVGKGWTLGVGFEVLEGDDESGFQTPLATLHKFNGWADQFLSTPDGGLEDLYAKAVYVFSGHGNLLDNTKIVAMYHEFDADDSSLNASGADSYGDELDLMISHPLNVSNVPLVKSGSVALKYADYNADDFKTDKEILWFTTQFKF